MHSSSSFEVTAGVYVGSECSFEYQVCGDMVELELGGRHGLNVAITEDGLRNLIASAAEALAAMRAEALDQYP